MYEVCTVVPLYTFLSNVLNKTRKIYVFKGFGALSPCHQ